MKKIMMVLMISSACGMQCFSQVNVGQMINNVKNTVKGNSLSNDEIIRGLKDALSIGSQNSADKASQTDGYYKNSLIKIPFPKEAQQMENTLKNLGMGKQVEQFVLTLNRAAEDAAKKAAPIFVEAIKKMTIADGLSILKGNDDAATVFLKTNTSENLKNQFLPVVKASLNKVEITRYWNPLMTRYNQVPMVRKVNPDLDLYVTQRAIDGLFMLVAQEELKIRKDPAARVTDILRKVFGNK